MISNAYDTASTGIHNSIYAQTGSSPSGAKQQRAGKRIGELASGDKVASPAGRLLLVEDVFVPRSNREKSRTLPSQFRNLNRKVVVFKNGSLAPLKEIQTHYRQIA